MKKMVGLVTALTLIPSVAFADTAASRVADQTVEVIAYAVGIALATLFGKLILAFERRFKVDVPDAFEVYLNGLLDKGIHYAEEQSRKAAKAAGAKLDMGATLEHAAAFVLDIADKRKVQEMGKEKVKKLIEARLNARRGEIW